MTRLAKSTQNQQGFTLVELTLSMAFIAMLLLGIALLTLQIGSIYNKGLTLRAVNEAGQLVSSDMQRTLNVAKKLTTTTAPADLTTAEGGRLCIESTVYAWNFGNRLSDGFNTGAGEVRFVKFVSANGPLFYCQEQDGGGYPPLPSSGVVDILRDGENDLALHSFSFTSYPVTGDDTQELYEVAFTLGTRETSILEGNGCGTPLSITDDEYCAINEFKFIARAGNK